MTLSSMPSNYPEKYDVHVTNGVVVLKKKIPNNKRTILEENLIKNAEYISGIIGQIQFALYNNRIPSVLFLQVLEKQGCLPPEISLVSQPKTIGLDGHGEHLMDHSDVVIQCKEDVRKVFQRFLELTQSLGILD